MDQPQYSNLLAGMRAVPDPRKPPGKQLEWTFLWGLIACALLSNQRRPAAIAQWVRDHAALLLASFRPARGRIPSESTIRRTLRQGDIAALEAQLACIAVPAAVPPSRPLRGQAIDGKHLRGVGAHGEPQHLVSLVEHGSGRVLAQTAVAPRQHESRAVPTLLADRDLTGVVVTLEAGLAHPALAAQIRRQGGHYLMAGARWAKRNQHQLFEELTWFVDTPPLPCDPPWRADMTCGKGHRRLETRHLTCTAELDNYLAWPGVQQVLRRECERIELKTGKVSQATTSGLTSVTPAEATVADIAAWWRRVPTCGCWTIENRVHYVRDVSMGEDAHQMHTGHAPQALAALRNTLLNLLRWAGWTNIAAALRHYANAPREALQFIGAGSRL